MSVYNKRSSSEALGASSQQDTLKKMRITSSQIVDLEEEEPKDKTCMEMVEGAIENEEAVTRSMPQSENNTKDFSSRKHIFSQTLGAVYQSKEYLMN
jgi:hypothetical protein